jgi:hypothetical protein
LRPRPTHRPLPSAAVAGGAERPPQININPSVVGEGTFALK